MGQKMAASNDDFTVTCTLSALFCWLWLAAAALISVWNSRISDILYVGKYSPTRFSCILREKRKKKISEFVCASNKQQNILSMF